ncbi:MAG: DUF5686 family protein, partial [Saprospiraceae bacterium]
MKGQILDATNKEPLIYVNVQFENTSIGTTSDIDGKFFISTTERIEILRVSYVGYTTRNIKIKPGQVNDLNILLDEEGVNLDAVEIKVEKYRNKGNPAVELIKNVIQNKDKNRKEALDFYSYHKHEKLEFSLNNVTEKMRQNFIFRKINFIFDNADTNKVNGKIFLPFFLKENLSDIYYRKDPKAKKEHLRAEKITNAGEILNSVGISNMMTQMYQEIDFYDNTIMLLTNGFVSPLSPISSSIYRFYIQDTTVVNHKSLIHVFFAPRTKTDFAFVGHLWIANDSTYAVHKIEAGISKDINLNWVRELQISQEYDWVYEDSGVSNSSGDNKKAKSLMLSKDEIFVDFGISKKDSIRSVLGRKTSSYKNITINQKHQDSVFNFSGTQFRYNDASSKSEAFWSENRNSPLTASEQGIYNMVDSLNNFKPFKRAMTIARLVFEGYTSIGSFDLGPANTFYSFNPIEGFRLRLGGRTNLKFSKRILLEGYGAYGFRDKQIKGYAALRY